MTVQFERDELYREVWSTPLTQLAKKYGLSDNGIRKVCKALNIPLPKGGHWAKVAAGHAVEVAPLPLKSERVRFVSTPKPLGNAFGTPEDEVWLRARLEFDATEPFAVALTPPKRWHTAVSPIREDHRAAMKASEKFKKDFERGQKHKGHWLGPDFHGGYWQPFLDKGQLLVDTHKSYPVRVSPLTCDRALAILDVLCKAAERRGFTASLDDKNGRIVFDGHGGHVQLRIAEKLIDGTRTEINSWSKEPEVRKTKSPSGLLRIFVGRTFAERQIPETTERPLESRLPEVFESVYRCVIRCREDRREHDANTRRREEEDRRRAAEEAIRRMEEERRAEERNRREELVANAKAWETANLVRRYVAHRVGSSQGASEDAWRQWALGVADEIEKFRFP